MQLYFPLCLLPQLLCHNSSRTWPLSHIATTKHPSRLLLEFHARLLLSFHYKHGKLGFHPDCAACYIGSTESIDIWVLFVHEDKPKDDANTLPAGSSFTNPTQLSAKHFHQFLSWMLYHPSLIQVYIFTPVVVTLSIWITSAQTGPLSPTSGASSPFQFKNNPLTSTTYRPNSHQIKLNFQQAQDLHNTFTRDKYSTWQRSAPQEWSDSFFRSCIPLIIASCYSQDEPLKHFTPCAAQQLHELCNRN